jgi:hypothetical protein
MHVHADADADVHVHVHVHEHVHMCMHNPQIAPCAGQVQVQVHAQLH